MFNKEDAFSRFIKTTDYNTNDFIYNISEQWWSRLYEYPWAGKFADKYDICLDAACGIEHHFKYYLAENCKKVYCCDLDERLKDREYVFSYVKEYFGEEAYNRILRNTEKITFDVCNLSNLPYKDKSFDKIYCISVLEHMSLSDRLNTFNEFKRCLKDNGIIILTMDYPSVNLNEFKEQLDNTNLKFKYGYDFNIPEECLVSEIYPGLSCFRAIISKT
ncbi:class I SAM-dependent methyltransferase [Clostridium tarantellae]|uniref:Methyltransferase domain-containing protein n=1 Tax=Clostridium tarantellae TaxID=39493 RepID=A0A6I1MJB0_9CLOT|nr:class I SAM-dependent methyltransferase [Clostridium tarantellae]MPQ43024.1 methyltransferase domain-containing protein [Clostridium tarantellae]